MAGGLLNFKAEGANNVILNGNPSKTFFKVAYSKYSNFGLQKFRIDYDGLRELRPFEESKFTFKVPRYADLLMDTYLSVTLPNIWSPIYHPTENTNNRWSPYEFKWIRKLGVHMIKEVTISCGSQTIQKYSGEYLDALVERDFSAEKKDLFNVMTGNVPELYDPANVHGRANTYPSAFYTGNDTVGSEPSIRGKTLYIPLNTWFSLDSKCPLPLISLQYNQIEISVTMRPIQELFQIRDVFDQTYNFPYVKPDLNENRFQIYRFLQSPPNVFLDSENYGNKISTWNADIHLMSTYCFLSKQEQQKFALEDQIYLIKEVHEHKYENVTGTRKLKVPTNGMVSNWMWFMRRNDVHLRNEWSNYTNWPYYTQPGDIELAPRDIGSITIAGDVPNNYGPGVDWVDGRNTGFYVTGNFKSVNRREIMETFGILMNGDYRENMQNRGVFDYVEKYVRTGGYAQEGLYCYNFCLNTNPYDYQPSGAFNMSNIKTIEIELTTHVPDIDLVNSRYDVICDLCGNAIGTRKSSYQLYDYNYNLTLFEERYNVLSFMGGNCGLMYAR